MDQNFSLMAQSRANYYTAGSPVQFVRVELLKGDTTGEVAVCLTFKNVGTEPLTGLVVHFKCKDAAGQVLCEDDFYYEQLNAQPGAVFGSDDAVYVSDTPVSSVEVEQDRAFLNGRGVDLRNYKRVRLNMPRVLPGSIGEVSKIALLLGFAYLLVRRVIGAHIPLIYLGVVFALSSLFGGAAPSLLLGAQSVLTGGVLLGAIFMATDYVTAPQTPWGRALFGIGAGLLTCLIRFYGSYAEGVSFAILFMNILTPYLSKWTASKPFGGAKA